MEEEEGMGIGVRGDGLVPVASIGTDRIYGDLCAFATSLVTCRCSFSSLMLTREYHGDWYLHRVSGCGIPLYGVLYVGEAS